ncbi:DUF4241 domain-containing protein [Bacillus sp. SL00103]
MGLARYPFHDEVDIAMFTTGFGDGLYPSFWGLDVNGEPHLPCDGIFL